MRIRGILRDDIRTRSKLVERPAEQLDLLVHVLFCQGRPVELRWRQGSIEGDPALVMYVERCAERERAVPVDEQGPLVPVRLNDWDTVASVVGEVLESSTIDAPQGEDFVPAPI